MKKSFTSKVILMIVFVFTLSTVGEHFFVKADTTVNIEDKIFSESSAILDLTVAEYENASEKELQELGLDLKETNTFNKEILDPNYDPEEALEDLDVAKMTKEEKKNFEVLVQETVQLAGTDEPELLEESLTNLYDSRSETFGDLESAIIEIENNYEEKMNEEQSTVTAMIKNFITGTNSAEAVKKGAVRIGTNFAGSAINLALGFAVGGLSGFGVNAIRVYVKKVGKAAAKKTLSRVASAELSRLNVKAVAGVSVITVVGVAIEYAIDYFNVGGMIAKYIDNHDWYRGNGWIDISK